jgi:hypothetical protein
MSERDLSTPSGQDREGAVAAMRDLPGETALGHVDPGTVQEQPGGTTDIGDAARDAGFVADAATQQDGDPGTASFRPEGESGAPRPLEEMDRSDTSLGDRSTEGEAARQAVGVDPAQQDGGVVEDRSTGESTRADVAGDQG